MIFHSECLRITGVRLQRKVQQPHNTIVITSQVYSVPVVVHQYVGGGQSMDDGVGRVTGESTTTTQLHYNNLPGL